MAVSIAEILDPALRSRMCEELLRGLPQWFGIEQSIRHYVRRVADLRSWAADVEDHLAGFLALEERNRYVAEIHVMAVRQDLHRRGIGSALMDVAEHYLHGIDAELLEVKTLGPSDSTSEYDATRRFYEARGFRPLDELRGVWEGPCLIMVKTLR